MPKAATHAASSRRRLSFASPALAIAKKTDVAEAHYDIAVIRLANEDKDGAMSALATAIDLNPKLKDQAEKDSDLDALRKNDRFSTLIGK